MRNKFRALVDWDNDGYVNVGVPLGAPTNLLPYPAYMSGLTPVTLDNTASPALLSYVELEPEIHSDNKGLVKHSGIRGISAETTIVMGIDPEALIQKDLGTYSWRLLDFPVVLEANTTYTVTLWIYTDVVSDVTIDADIYQINTVNYTNGDTVTILSVPAETWTQIALTFTTYASSPTGLSISVLGDVAATVSAKGVMLVEGTAPHNFSAGDLAQYDDISADVLAANWRLGRAEFDKSIADEGTAEITLNNSSRKFSPANTASPLFGKLRQNTMVVLQVETSINNWVTVWTGWVRQFKAVAGTNSNQQASILCEQGLYRLREGSLDYQLEQDITVTDVVRRVLDNVGFRSAYHPYVTMLNYQAYLGWSTFIQDTNSLFSSISETTRLLQYAGSDWGRKTTPEEALIGVLEADNAKLWIDREGGLFLQVREDFINQEADHSLILDTDVQDAEYAYGEKIINRVEVFVEPPKEVTDEVIWATKEPIAIQGHPFGDGNLNKYTRYIELDFAFEEGKQRVLTEINGSDASKMTITVYKRNPRKYTDPTPYIVPSGEWQGQIHATVLGSQSLRRRLQVRNNLEYPVWIDIEITGSYFEGGEGGLWVEEDAEAQNFVSAVMNHRIELPALSNEEQALSYAKYMIHRYARPYGEFRSITVLDANLDIKMGDVVSITEIQTGEENVRHTVIEENGNYSSGGVVEIVYTLARLDEQLYYAVGDTLEQSTLNIIPNLLDKLYPSASTFEKVAFKTEEGDTAYLWNTGQANSGVLLFGNVDAVTVHMWENSYDATNDIHDFVNVDTKGFITGVRTIDAPANPASADFDLETEYSGSIIPILSYIKNGIYYISAGIKSLTGNNIIGSIVRNDTGATLGSQPTSSAPSHIRLITPSFSVTPDTYKLIARSQSGAGLGTNTIAWGDASVIHLPSFPIDELGLEASTDYYLTIWLFAEVNTSENLNAIIVAEDGTTILNTSLNIVDGFNKKTALFTTGSSNNKKHGIILADATGTTNIADMYLYGMSITKDIPETYNETNEQTLDLPQIYL